MAKITGMVGYRAKRYSVKEGMAIGKFTDKNHLENLQHSKEPAMYDRSVISLYTQTNLFASDLLQMINKSSVFYPEYGEKWQWNLATTIRLPKVTHITAETIAKTNPGRDGQEFTFCVDRGDMFFANQVVTTNEMWGQKYFLTKDPQPHPEGFLITATLITETPKTDSVDLFWLQPGSEMSVINNLIGEFDQDLPGLPGMGDKITLFDSMSAGYALKHKITGWADCVKFGGRENEKELIMYEKWEQNEAGKIVKVGERWEPFIETLMRKHMLTMRMKRMLWSEPGIAKSRGAKQEVKKSPEGLIYKLRQYGNRIQYNKGEFSINLLRAIFGDLFYRRVGISQRRVKLYTNEAGFEVFKKAAKDDLFNSGLTVIADDRFITGKGQTMMVDWAFSSVVTSDTGKIELVHLQELDLPVNNRSYGKSYKSEPIFIVFDVSPMTDGSSLANNLREVRLKGQPGMSWGYVEGRRHHLGFAASQGHSAASFENAYGIFMDDRSDLFIEDYTRCVIIEQIPQY